MIGKGENIKKLRALMLTDRGVQSKNKIFLKNFIKYGYLEHLVQLASFQKESSDPNKGEGLFNDTDPVERKIAKDFYVRLRETISDWNSRLGSDKNNKITPFKTGYDKAFDGAARGGRL